MYTFLVYIIAIIISCVCIYVKRQSIREPKVFESDHLIPYTYDVRKDKSIFVSIASYRDRKCSMTVNSIFQNANRPERVFIGICQQNDHNVDDECITNTPMKQNIRIVRLDYKQAKGPCYARYLCSCLYQGENYYVQIDSHTVFIPGWDSALIRMMKRLPLNGVISHYPQPINIETFETEAVRQYTIPIICGADYNNDVITFKGMELNENKVASMEPNVNVGTSGGFLCMPGEAVYAVPFDPNLDMLFQGEEILYSARLFTSGYDFYPPTKNIVYHYYDRKEEPKFWNDIKDKPTHDPKQIVKSLLNNESIYITNNYGLGNVRTIDEYWDILGYDPSSHIFYKDTCKF